MITDYKYRKARKLVTASRVKKGVKELMFCALKQYRGKLTPAMGVYQSKDGERACLIGAALASRWDGFNKPDDGPWEMAASTEFGITCKDAGDIIDGFDATGKVYGGRTMRLAKKVSIALGLVKMEEEPIIAPF